MPVCTGPNAVPNVTYLLQLLLALQKFGNNLDDYLHLVLPPIVRLFDAADCPVPVCRVALETVDHLADTLDFTDFASRIVHPLVRTLDSCPELRPTAMETLCALVVQLGRKYQIFIPLVQKVIMKHKINCQRYEILTCKIVTVSSVLNEVVLSLDQDKNLNLKIIFVFNTSHKQGLKFLNLFKFLHVLQLTLTNFLQNKNYTRVKRESMLDIQGNTCQVAGNNLTVPAGG